MAPLALSLILFIGVLDGAEASFQQHLTCGCTYVNVCMHGCMLYVLVTRARNSTRTYLRTDTRTDIHVQLYPSTQMYR